MTIQTLQSGPQSRIRVEDVSQVGECRRIAQSLAQAHRFAETLVGRVGIVATELANNVVRHAGHGEVLIQAISDGSLTTLELIAMDKGPGMDVDKCMRDGYSTAGTAGTGLGAVSRMSTLFDVYSPGGGGTVAVSRVANRSPDCRQPSTAASPEFGAICIAVEGEFECGDTWRIAHRGNTMTIMVADGLGHGPLAATAARAAAGAFIERPFDPPSETMQRMHNALAGTRGAAAACATLSSASPKVIYAGVGNVAGCVISPEKSRGMVSHNGTLGIQLLRRQEFEYACPPGSRVVMHSDGVSARWSIDAYPGLLTRHAAVIAAVLFRDHARARDDATIVVAGGRQ